jgi:two-component system KDP operon response regulator KdpE
MKILIIEDDANIVEAITIAFQTSWPDAQVTAASLGEKGLELIETGKFDAVILDLGLPDINGFDILKQIRLFSDIPILILTVTSDEIHIIKGFELGADDYIVKPGTPLQLIARVKNILRLKAFGNDSPITYGSLHLEPSKAQVYYHGKEVHLTPTEYRILYCLLKHRGHIISNNALIRMIWGDEYPGSLDCIKVYIRNLRRKIEDDPAHPKIILTKSGMGHYIDLLPGNKTSNNIGKREKENSQKRLSTEANHQ